MDWMKWIGARAWQLASRELALLLAVLAIVLGVWLFIDLADNVVEGETEDYDTWIIEQMRTVGNPEDPIGPDWVESTAIDLTAMGGYPILGLLTAGTLVYLLLAGGAWRALQVAVSIVVGVGLIQVLKYGFMRDRPELINHMITTHTPSFPSGHAMGSAVVFMTLGVLLAQMASLRRLQMFFVLVAMLMTGLIGCTRVYLGVHYPSDVLAGWSLGLAWASLVWASAELIKRRVQSNRSSGDGPGSARSSGAAP